MLNVITLSLSKLEDEQAIPGVGEIIGKFMARACAVCLDYHKHKKGVRFTTDLEASETRSHYLFELSQWEEVTDLVQKKQWGDKKIAAEWAACGIAILIMFELTEYTTIAKARTGTGFDYWLGKKEYEENDPFKEEALLEVSGILEGSQSQVNRRLKEKLEQTELSADLNLPSFAAVIEFSKPIARVARK